MAQVKPSKGDIAFLKGRKEAYVKLTGSIEQVNGLGVVDTGKILELNYGQTVEIAGLQFLILRPSIVDNWENIQRKAQIILPKDAAVIGLYCNLRAGDVVVEGGAGSGALTMYLCHMVWPDGKVITYEAREDFAKISSKNLEKVGLGPCTEIKLGDVTKDVEEQGVQAFIVDIPNPWEAVPMAKQALEIGGAFASYVPNMNQVEEVHKKLVEQGFSEPHSMEVLVRNIVVHKGGVRPDFEMLGHTGYMTFSRRLE